MLGPLEVRDGAGSAREVSGTRLRALLVLLALRAGQVVPAGALIGELWGERLGITEMVLARGPGTAGGRHLVLRELARSAGDIEVHVLPAQAN